MPRQQVALEVALSVEGLRAQRALEGPQPSVDAEVLLKVESPLRLPSAELPPTHTADGTALAPLRLIPPRDGQDCTLPEVTAPLPAGKISVIRFWTPGLLHQVSSHNKTIILHVLFLFLIFFYLCLRITQRLSSLNTIPLRIYVMWQGVVLGGSF